MSRASQTSGQKLCPTTSPMLCRCRTSAGDSKRGPSVTTYVPRANTRRAGARRRAAAHQRLAPGRAHRVAHDEQMVADHEAVAVAVGGLIDEIVDDHEVAGVEEVVEAADAGVREDPLDAGAMEHAEHLARGAPPRDALAPPVQAHVQRRVPAELEERERRAVAPGGLEDEIALDDARLGVQIAGEVGGQRTGAADDGARGGGDRDAATLRAPPARA